MRRCVKCSFAFLCSFIALPRVALGAWCADGLHELGHDTAQPVEVIHAETPLLSQTLGNKLGYFGLYHTCLILAQGSGANRQNWTLEFEANNPTSTIGAMVPEINGTKLIWRNAGRWCLTKGVKWGRDHWSHAFTLVGKLQGPDATTLFQKLLPALNGTVLDERPVYQLWRVDKRVWPWEQEQNLIPEVTCGNGVQFFLHSAQEMMKLPQDFKFKISRIVIDANEVEAVDASDPAAWAEIVAHYKDLANIFADPSQQLQDAWKFLTLPPKFVYDGNAARGHGVYYRVLGYRFFPFRLEYKAVSLTGLPWSRVGHHTSQNSIVV